VVSMYALRAAGEPLTWCASMVQDMLNVQRYEAICAKSVAATVIYGFLFADF